VEKIPVDVMSVVSDDLLKSWYVEQFELAQGKCFDLDELPLVGEL